MTTNQCVFCNIIRDPAHPAPIYRDDKVTVLRDIHPKARTHLLIIPNQHLNGLAYIGPGQVPIMGHLFVVAEEMARREGVTLTGYRLAMNQGKDSGQEIDHIHMHLLAGQRLGGMG